VAAAADLSQAFAEVGAAFEARTGQKVVFSFGSTGLLAKQIAEGAPFDLFAAADTSYADQLTHQGVCAADSRTLYARGRIVAWTRRGLLQQPLKSLEELREKRFVKIAIANPEHAPYGRAAMQALASVGIVDEVRPRLVFGENVRQALQFAQSGNAEVAVVALSLAVGAEGDYLSIDEGLHRPIDQALVVCGKDKERTRGARAFSAFVGSEEGRRIMRRYGFLLPGELALGKP
jgi:molybdate transport system substrate-binding protein